MQQWRDPITLVVAGFLLVAVLSGPVVSGVDLTPAERSSGSTGPSLATSNGTLTAADTALARTEYRFEAGVRGSGIHKLATPPATLTVESVTGTALVAYTIRIPELGYMTESLRVVESDTPRELTLTIGESTISSDRLEAGQYTGMAEIAVRRNGTSRVIATESITVEVA
ncbi:hypothetical protein ACFQE1_02540 [Halobium palmae]|uniref:Uncharacterized protein n=1 Tax=Halobium palmae TaxID=1776492 RepID=A0ABD5RVN4_9EURY